MGRGRVRKNPNEMTFREHLLELRDRLKMVAISYFVALIFWLAFPSNISLTGVSTILTGEYKPLISAVLEETVSLAGGIFRIIPGRLVSPLEIYFIAAALVAFITVIPVIGYEIYAYVNPALYPHERKLVWPFLAAFIGLFATGAFFSYFIVVPLIIRFMAIFADIIGISPELRLIEAGDYYMFVFSTVGSMGLLFTAPAIFLLLVRLGILSSNILSRNRIYFYGILYIIIAFITPDGWLVGNTILFLPLVAMMEISLLIARRIEKKREMGAYSVPRCKFCGAEISEEVVFCPKCGKSQQ
ncbi:MAG: twin-arginine translocase subunit TatC [Nitrososphaerota archaeon]|nr:twin-arginine translocase subunit TatC [Candidatus Calditenuaceae archaeon]MDW8072650.1 twin-arginine translocase subunit TatC [Nitrososphaerota archaeon]